MEIKRDLVSVVVPVYKTLPELLLKCLNSIRSQTYEQIEVLVVDDGTPDRSYDDIAEKFQHDARFSFYRKENGGLSDARNYGIDRAEGEFICFIDSDDFVDKDYVLDLHKAIEGADLSVCGTCETDHPTIEACVRCEEFFSKPSEFCQLPYTNFATNKLYRTKTFFDFNLRFPRAKGMIGEDAMFHKEFFRHCTRIHSISKSHYHYVPNFQSIMHTYNSDFWKWEKQIIAWQWKMFHMVPLAFEEERYMRVWLYFKMKDCVNYYLKREKNPQTLKMQIDRINESVFMKELVPLLVKGEGLRRKDREILRLWLKKGSSGMIWFDKLKKFIRLGR